jgi:hypothetical protein
MEEAVVGANDYIRGIYNIEVNKSLFKRGMFGN